MTIRTAWTSRRAFASVWLGLWLAGGLMIQREAQAAEKYWVYVGTYTNSASSPSEGVYKLEFDPETGTLTPKGTAAKTENPTFLAVHPSGGFLYAVNEVGEFQGEKNAGGVSAFRIDPATGGLTLLNQLSSQGGAPCHLAVDPTGKALVVANYSGGSVISYPIAEDGSLKPAASFIQHEGAGVDPGRQKGPHAHSANFDPAGTRVMVADLGLDKVLVYQLNPADAELTSNTPAFATTLPGAGPRHLSWRPDGRFAYVINEMGGTIDVFDYNAETGALTSVQTISTLPEGHDGQPACAEVVVHPSGRFVYGSNRGHDSLAVYRVDEETGQLTSRGWTPTGGKTPRNFVIDPTGAWLLAENQDSDSIVVFAIDPNTGALTRTGDSVSIPKPVCIRFLAQPASN